MSRSELITNIIIALSSTFLGVIIGLFIENIKSKLKFKQELKDNNSINITGDDWFAAWHTSVENTINLNTEQLSFKQKGKTIKVRNLEKAPENPKGGYLWQAQLQFFYGKTLMGWYFPLKIENITSKGIMFLTYKSTKKVFWGKWVGSSYDGDLSNGFVVISKDRNESLKLDIILEKNIEGIISNELCKEKIAAIDRELYQTNKVIADLPETKINYVHLLGLIRDILKNPGNIWDKADFVTKIKLQWFYFPDGIEFDGKENRTTKICKLFKLKELISSYHSYNVPEVGLEPTRL